MEYKILLKIFCHLVSQQKFQVMNSPYEIHSVLLERAT